MTSTIKSVVAGAAIGVTSVLVWPSDPAPKPPRVLLEGRIPAHWCQQPPEKVGVAFYRSTDLSGWSFYDGTNPFVADKPFEFFIAVHFCSESQWEQIPIHITKL